MDTGSERRRELVREYKLRPKPAGIYCIRNTVNGRILLGSRLNLDGVLNRHRFTLSMGSHKNKELQREWNEYGEEAFQFEILEQVKVEERPGFKIEDELAFLEELWIEKLNPSSSQSYNTTTKLQQE